MGPPNKRSLRNACFQLHQLKPINWHIVQCSVYKSLTIKKQFVKNAENVINLIIATHNLLGIIIRIEE